MPHLVLSALHLVRAVVRRRALLLLCGVRAEVLDRRAASRRLLRGQGRPENLSLVEVFFAAKNYKADPSTIEVLGKGQELSVMFLFCTYSKK